jgi:hypothetical protein
LIDKSVNMDRFIEIVRTFSTSVPGTWFRRKSRRAIWLVCLTSQIGWPNFRRTRGGEDQNASLRRFVSRERFDEAFCDHS